MKILLLAPVHNEHLFYSSSQKYPLPESQVQTSWIRAIKKLGHEVKTIRYTESILVPNKLRSSLENVVKNNAYRLRAKLQRIEDNNNYLNIDNFFKNRRIEKFAIHYSPNIIIISGGAYSIFPSVIKRIKDKTQCKVIIISGVNPTHGSPKAEKQMIKKDLIDLVIVNDAGFKRNWQKFGAKRVITLPISAIDETYWKKIELTKKEREAVGANISFVGTLTDERVKFLSKIKRDDMKIWGDIPSAVDIKSIKDNYVGVARGQEVVKIFNASKIILNIHAREMKYGGNLRTFEIPGCGGFQLVDNIDEKWFQNKKEVIRFSSVADLQKKMDYYLKHENKRKKIAKAGYMRCLKDHTYVKRFSTLFNLLNHGPV